MDGETLPTAQERKREPCLEWLLRKNKPKQKKKRLNKYDALTHARIDVLHICPIPPSFVFPSVRPTALMGFTSKAHSPFQPPHFSDFMLLEPKQRWQTFGSPDLPVYWCATLTHTNTQTQKGTHRHKIYPGHRGTVTRVVCDRVVLHSLCVCVCGAHLCVLSDLY